MAYADQEMSGNRVIAIVIVALIHIALGYLLISGLAISAVKDVVERVTTVDVEEEEPEPPEEEPPPPPPEDVPDLPPPPVVVPPPPIDLNSRRNEVDSIPDAPATFRPDPRPAPTPRPTAAPAPAPAPAPTRSQARGVQPEGQAGWARRIQENYPSRAIRRELEGRVGVTVQVGTNGRVSGCRVSSSSGESVLDDAACADITRFARFNPALNDAGQPISASWSTTIVYQLGN